MKAVVCRKHGPPESLVIEELPSPVAAAGEAVIAVEAASVNFPDVLIIQGKYQVKPPLPFSPGCELSGTVQALGAGVTNVRIGDRVMAYTEYGAFAEQAVVKAARLVQMPRAMDFAS